MGRSLLLVAAAFAAGLLAGTLVWTGDEDARARTGRPGTTAPTSAGAPYADRPEDSRAGEGPARANGADVRATDPALRALAREADAEIERVVAAGAPGTAIHGDGTIEGTVRDPEGDPVAGAFVTATPEAQPAGLFGRAQRNNERPHLDADLREVAGDAIQRELWRRRVRRVATTGADGRYELTGLPDQALRVTAFHERFEIQPVSRQNRVTPDATVDFLAQPVVPVRVEVRLPEGGHAENAWLVWEGPHGRGWGVWTPDEPELRLAVGTCKVTATTQTPTPMQSEPVERTFAENEGGEPLVLVLAARRILTARLAMPEGFAPPDDVTFRIRAVGKGDDIDPATLEGGPNARGEGPDRASWYDLEAGRYLIAAFLNRDRLLAHATTELGEGPVEVELTVEDPADRRHLAVKVIGPDGNAPSGRAWFRLRVQAGDRPQALAPDAFRRSDGVWFLVLDNLDPEPEGAATLYLSVADLGTAERACDVTGSGTVTVRFDESGSLRVTVDGLEGCPVAGALHVNLAAEEGYGGMRAVGADGNCEVAPLQPGRYRLQLVVREKNRTWALHQFPLTVRPGEQEARVTVPPLHTLRVRPARQLRARNVALWTEDPSIGPFRLDARIDGEGVATFPALAAGTYRIQVGPRQLEVRVPQPGIVEVE